MPDSLPPTFWKPNRDVDAPDWPVPPLTTAMLRGALGKCPACGETHAFAGYLKVVPECSHCHAPLEKFRADDAPPYFTIFIVAHVLITVLYWAETRWDWSMATLAAIFLPVSLIMTLALLRPVKGATLGLMLKLNMVKPDEA